MEVAVSVGVDVGVDVSVLVEVGVAVEVDTGLGFDVDVGAGGKYTNVFVGFVKTGAVLVASAVVVETIVCVVTNVPGVSVPAGTSAVVES